MDSFPEPDHGRCRPRHYSEEDEDLFQERSLFWETDGVEEDASIVTTRRSILLPCISALTFILAAVLILGAILSNPSISSVQGDNTMHYSEPTNNECIHATPLTISTTTDVNDPAHYVFGTVLGANKSLQGRLNQCSDILPMIPEDMNGLAGVWYRFTGTGDRIRISTCERTEMDTMISVFVPKEEMYEAEDKYCDGLECISINDDACGLQSSVLWHTVGGETYLIYVQGSVGFTLEEGNFALTVQIDNDVEPNDFCENAIDVTPDSGVVFGSNFAATGAGVEQLLPCGVEGFNSFSEGVWYSITNAEANTLQASTCRGSDFDTVLHVFSGTCSELSCISGDANSCGWNSRLEFEASANQTYYLYVHGGWTGSRGKFGLEVSSK